MPRRRLKGIVLSDKMDKTVVVGVDVLKEHPKYKKRYKSSARYKAHDETNQAKEGERVTIEEMRPLSKEKRWRLITEDKRG